MFKQERWNIDKCFVMFSLFILRTSSLLSVIWTGKKVHNVHNVFSASFTHLLLAVKTYVISFIWGIQLDLNIKTTPVLITSIFPQTTLLSPKAWTESLHVMLKLPDQILIFDTLLGIRSLQNYMKRCWNCFSNWTTCIFLSFFAGQLWPVAIWGSWILYAIHKITRIPLARSASPVSFPFSPSCWCLRDAHEVQKWDQTHSTHIMFEPKTQSFEKLNQLLFVCMDKWLVKSLINVWFTFKITLHVYKCSTQYLLTFTIIEI